MNVRFVLIALGLLLAGLVAHAHAQRGVPPIRPTEKGPARKDKVVLTKAQWKARLAPKAFIVLREDGTEMPGSSSLLSVHAPGTFSCAGCRLPLFRTADKFDSGTGWPSFARPITKDAVWYRPDDSSRRVHNDVRCARCDGHLGHVFDDGPRDRTGLRYCIDGDALVFKPDKKRSGTSQ